MKFNVIQKIYFDFRSKRYLISLLLFSLLFQVVFLLASPIGFECDAAMFYNYAKAIIFQGRSASDYRPPAFPLFLLITGQIWPGTLMVTLFFQLAMGILMPILVFEILKRFGNSFAVFGSVLTVFSTIPYNYATLILSDQLFGFTFLLAIYFFTCFFFEKSKRDLRWFLVASLVCTFTRWEGIFLLFNGLIYISYYYCKAKRFKTAILLNFAIVMLFLLYTVVRAIYFHDIKMVGSLQNGSGLQLFYRAYTGDYPAFQKNKPRDNQSLVSTNNGDLDPGNSVQFVSVLNGPSTQKLKEIVERFASENPDSYRKLKPFILNLPISNSYSDSYETLYGRFDGQPKKMADHIFTTPSSNLNSQYLFYINRAVKASLGTVDGDKLLVSSAIEAFVANPIIVFSMLNDSLSILGVDLFNFLSGINKGSFSDSMNLLFPYWGRYHYDWLDFDLAKCASHSLSPHMINELKLSYKVADRKLNRELVGVASFNRNLTRVALGISIILLGWTLLFSQNRLYLCVLVGTFLPMILIYGAYIGGAYTRYEVATIPLMIIIAMQIFIGIKRRLSFF
jgi:hypothetical protein